MVEHDIADRTVVVTGGAGFVGSHLAAALVDRNDVRVVDDLSTGRASKVPDGAELVRGDVRDDDLLATALADADVVFHQAALVDVPTTVEDPRRSHDINASATVGVLEAAREVGARVVVASSAAVYGHPESVPVGEDAPKSPTTPYGIDKLAADHYARAYADLYDLPTVALRYFNVYGPGQPGGGYSGVIDAFLERALRGQDLVVHGDGSQTRDFVHVSDVVRANLAAATTDRVGEAFNVGTGRSVTIGGLAERVVDLTGADVDVVHDEGRPGDIERSRADVSKARAGLGFEPAVSLTEGLATLLESPPAD